MPNVAQCSFMKKLKADALPNGDTPNPNSSKDAEDDHAGCFYSPSFFKCLKARLG
jgi:hypothetical protein